MAAPVELGAKESEDADEGNGGGVAAGEDGSGFGGGPVGGEAAIFADCPLPRFEYLEHGDVARWVAGEEPDEGELGVEGVDDEGRS